MNAHLTTARNPIADLLALADEHDHMLAANPSSPWLSDVADALGIDEAYGFVAGVRAILSNRLETYRGLYFVPGAGDLDSMTGGETDYVEGAASEMLDDARAAIAASAAAAISAGYARQGVVLGRAA